MLAFAAIRTLRGKMSATGDLPGFGERLTSIWAEPELCGDLDKEGVAGAVMNA